MSPLRDSAGLYCGPIVDAHHHFWDLAIDRHPWLRGQQDAVLTRNCLPQDYLRDTRGYDVIASVHVEANWDATNPLGEIAWLDSLERPSGIAGRYVGFADLRAPDVEDTLAAMAANGRVTGIRQIVSWHPDPARSAVADKHLVADPQWRRGLAALGRYGLSFDLLISPWQVAEVLDLLAAFPEVAFALNHCGSPFDRTVEGMANWASGLSSLARVPNLVLKISDMVAYDPDWTEASLRDVAMTCLDAFGPHRCLLASDHPVVTQHASFAQTYESFRRIFADLSDDELLAIFAGNAARFYNFTDIQLDRYP
ncbi:putative TIM-barrel fold metal-dependent hydrolase [Devosia subaequoris]|uniref:Putative TIM-barrel fold metal-dependent hydrolase n=1 Tax=Devosia subaequoris TaxID=395930 RepID=A0A7W6IRA0_9HYPH|nr:amidohydrolase family protein [Devosia subaequoris]MBB4053635.1 putative TIM-barrel fold metal-dependent hydrolase [Devosia subaequoris]MCP1211230.1 amidohydrolase family protein [Devosia subaequoris]